MPKRPTPSERLVMRGETPPPGLTRVQLREWNQDVIERRRLETMAATAAAVKVWGPIDTAELAPAAAVDVEPSGRWARMWNRRPLLAAIALITGLLAIVIPTQIGYYRRLGGLNPEFAGGAVFLRTYLMVPIATELLSAYFALLAGYVIATNAGRYRRYLRLMWLFATVAAIVNVKSGWNLGDETHVTAFLLGALSLSVPLVWHSYAGMTIAVKHSGLTIADIAESTRRWFRHPLLSWRCARAIDLFPEMARAEVWELVVRNQRAKVMDRLATTPDVRRELRSRADRETFTAGAAAVDGVSTVADIQRGWWNRLVARLNPFVPRADERPPVVTSAVDVIERREVPPESAVETSGEIRGRERIVAAWFDVCGDHLPNPAVELPRGGQAELARVTGLSKSYVSKLIRECVDGVHANPFQAQKVDSGE